MRNKNGANALFKDAILTLAKAGAPRPGTAGPGVCYLIECDPEGAVTKCTVHISDDAMGRIFDELTDGHECGGL
jgi:hypothetical protein